MISDIDNSSVSTMKSTSWTQRKFPEAQQTRESGQLTMVVGSSAPRCVRNKPPTTAILRFGYLGSSMLLRASMTARAVCSNFFTLLVMMGWGGNSSVKGSSCGNQCVAVRLVSWNEQPEGSSAFEPASQRNGPLLLCSPSSPKTNGGVAVCQHALKSTLLSLNYALETKR